MYRDLLKKFENCKNKQVGPNLNSIFTVIAGPTRDSLYMVYRERNRTDHANALILLTPHHLEVLQLPQISDYISFHHFLSKWCNDLGYFLTRSHLACHLYYPIRFVSLPFSPGLKMTYDRRVIKEGKPDPVKKTDNKRASELNRQIREACKYAEAYLNMTHRKNNENHVYLADRGRFSVPRKKDPTTAFNDFLNKDLDTDVLYALFGYWIELPFNKNRKKFKTAKRLYMEMQNIITYED